MEHKLNFETYNNALKQDKLLGLKCRECSTITTPPKMACRHCASPNMEVVTLSGKGTIQSFTTVYVAPEGLQKQSPYTVLLVELDEGPWLMGNLSGVNPEKTTMELIGKKVKLGHRIIQCGKNNDNETAVPLFQIEE